MSKSLLKFQIGPVQDFIAAARSTRDLWSGSYLLSWLVAAGICKLRSEGGELVFPYPEGQPLLAEKFNLKDPTNLLTPNLPNVFIAIVTADPASVAKEVTCKIKDEWQTIAKEVWKQRSELGIPDAMKERFFGQVDRHLSISWTATPIPGAYEEAYRQNGKHLDAVRQTRDFIAWHNGSESKENEKDSLTGKEEAVCGGKSTTDDGSTNRDISKSYRHLFKHHDYLGATSLIKRVWHLAYLQDYSCDRKPKFPTSSKDFKIRSIPAIAARTDTLDDEEEAQEKTIGERYIAAIAFDGDSIGKWVSGELLESGNELQIHHQDFSKALSRFALEEARSIVEKPLTAPDGTPLLDRDGQPIPLGQLIYAGGDDVVALVPADAALGVAKKLREAFRKATNRIKGKELDAKTHEPLTPDASAGIAIAHIKSPLQDLVRNAQKAEKDAKRDTQDGGQGRSAFSITLMKRSGEISKWGAKWDSGGIELMDALSAANQKGKLSAKFPYRLIELLEVYLTHRTDLSLQADVTGFPVREIIEKEFAHTATRQGSREVAESLREPLEDYLVHLTPTTTSQGMLKAIIGLCTTLSFISRNQSSAERQPSRP